MAIQSRFCGGSVTIMVVLGIALAAGADYLFYRQPVGWTLGLFVAVWAMVVTLKRPSVATGAVCLLVLGLALAIVEEPGFLDIFLAWLGLLSLAAVSRGGWTSKVSGWLLRWWWYAMGPIVAPVMDLAIIRRWQSRHPGATSRWSVSLMKWTLPVVLGAVFVGLFGLANPIIADWLSWLRVAIAEQIGVLSVERVLIWIVVLIGTWTLLRHKLLYLRVNLPKRSGPVFNMSPLDWLLSPGVVVRCLVLFNVIFAVQTVLDARYLWGDGVLPEGMSFATYAHRGAYPLVATALLAGAFVMATFRSGGAAERSAWAKGLVYLWIAQNILLLFAAVWRLSIYVDAYSLTRWRIAAGIWMAMVAVGFLLVVVRIITKRSNAWLGRSNAVLLAAVLYLCGFINFDRIIADYNVAHCAEVRGEGVPIDMDYLEALGVDALPALRRLRDEPMARPLASDTGKLIRRFERKLKKDLDDWRGWTWRRAQLASE